MNTYHRVFCILTTALSVTNFLACNYANRGANCDNPQAECSSDKYPEGTSRLVVDPPLGLGFACVSLGCDETQSMMLSNAGDSVVHVTDLRIVSETSDDFIVSLWRVHEDGYRIADYWPTQAHPLAIPAHERVEMRVRYKPTDIHSDAGIVRLAWFDGLNAGPLGEPSRITLPLRARTLQAASAHIESPELRFGYVELGELSQMPVRIKNISQRDSILEITRMDTSALPQGVWILPGYSPTANAGETLSIPLVYRPSTLAPSIGHLTVFTNDPSQPSLRIDVQGTSLADGQFVLSAATLPVLDIVLDDPTEPFKVTVVVQNVGGMSAIARPEVVASHIFGYDVLFPNGGVQTMVEPFGFAAFEVNFVPQSLDDSEPRIVVGDGAVVRLRPRIRVVP